MSKNINNYLPKVLQPIIEFQNINTNLDKELDVIDRYIKQITKETLVSSATEYGISRWEKSLNIIPVEGDSLEVRRFRIINILTSKLPYSFRWLQNKLTQIVGSESGWVLDVVNKDYTIVITLSGLDTALMAEVQKQLRGAIPANMELVIGGPQIESSLIRFGVGMMYGTVFNIKSSYNAISYYWNPEDFINGAIAEDGSIDTSMEGEAIVSEVMAVYPDRPYIFENDQGFLVYGFALYDIFGELIKREVGVNSEEITIPPECNLIRIEVRDGNGIYKEDITGAYLLQK